MKTLLYLLIIIAIASIGYNATKLDANQLLNGDSMIAVTGIVAALCSVLLVTILLISFKIKDSKASK